MFGIGFTEILLISIIAILFLGPDKLPQALVDMAKFIKDVKKTVSDAKGSLEEEMKIADLKEEALSYKKQLTEATDELKGFKNISFDDFDDESYDDEISSEDSETFAKQNNKKDTYAEAPKELTKPEEESIATQIEPKNDTVTFKKKPKESKKSTSKKIAKNDDSKNNKGDA